MKEFSAWLDSEIDKLEHLVIQNKRSFFQIGLMYQAMELVTLKMVRQKLRETEK